METRPTIPVTFYGGPLDGEWGLVLAPNLAHGAALRTVLDKNTRRPYDPGDYVLVQGDETWHAIDRTMWNAALQRSLAEQEEQLTYSVPGSCSPGEHSWAEWVPTEAGVETRRCRICPARLARNAQSA